MELTSKIKEGLNKLLDSSKEPEIAEQVGAIIGLCDNADNEYNSLIDAHAELKNKYVQQVKNGIFKTEPEDEVEKHHEPEKSLEDIATEILDNQK